ncbi:alpha/beta fold hydrolase [Modestobacter sp. Leaf380]|uniref:alpha/beta fold hydrolase n=1 Tax=Modestobacter sp. Leaf380 TaxID=1736356 RepID=UPI0006FD0671|nr:alpha/beta hydrolase [Modestobacter sp. Leaf380]KQS66693.1 alpha/beta hydrolase [Modestobacter sp. Leaf380]
MTQFLTTEGGTLAYDLTGTEGPLVVLAHGMGDTRRAYRSLTPALVAAGYRVAAVDLRGCGESSVEWDSYSRTAIAGDLVALVAHLGGPAVLVGHSIAGGAATIAAATAPELVSAVVELTPFTRAQSIGLGVLRVPRVRRGMTRLLRATLLGSIPQWVAYLDVAHPGAKPAGWEARIEEIRRSLAEPGRMAALKAMGASKPTDAGAQLAHVTCPVLVVQGSEDPDWVDPRAEGEAILADLPAGLGRLEVVEGSGHYPHVQHPDRVAALIVDFLADARA